MIIQSETITNEDLIEPSDSIESESVGNEYSTGTNEIEASFSGSDSGSIASFPGMEKKENVKSPPTENPDLLLDAYYSTVQGTTLGTRLLQEPKVLKETLENIIGPDDRIRIENTKQNPYRWICSLIITTKDNKRYIGTGFYIGKNTIATAAHCIYMHDHGGWAKSIEVIPGRDGPKRPYGVCSTTKFRTVAGWVKDKNSTHDYGAIIIPTDFIHGSQYGYFGFGNLSTDQLRNQLLYITGYPGDGGQTHIPGTLWTHARNISNITDTKINYDIDTFGGNSGCPGTIIKDGQVIVTCIHTTGGVMSNSGTRVRQDVFENLKKWKTEGDSQ
jgi:glutamyl endopeptidase